jgi:hypothetical protein
MRAEDLTGRTFNRLTVLCRGKNTKQRETTWLCRCACGKLTVVRRWHLFSGNTKACGCLQPEIVSRIARKHGMWQSREYCIWEGMKARCQNPKSSGYKYYGGRGIKVAPEFQTFEGFFGHLGPCPPKHTIDRIENDGHYAPGNVRWATKKVQMRNTRANRRYEFDGQTFTIVEWSELTGLPVGTIVGRLRLGWNLHRVFTTPARSTR